MTTDRTTKALLALIAIGLFMNAIVPLLQPPVVNARAVQGLPFLTPEPYNLEWRIYNGVANIANGTCLNRKIC